MFFHLFAETINLFRYLTFRAMFAAITAFLITVFLGKPIIEKLRVLRFGQQIREEGPSRHLEKTGTPTMGGIFLWGSVIVATLLWSQWNLFVLTACLSVILFGAIGFIDDYAKIKQKNTKGLSPLGKIICQSVSAAILLGIIFLNPSYHNEATSMKLILQNNDKEVIASTNVNISDSWEWNTVIPSMSQKQNISFSYKMINPDTGILDEKNIFLFPGLITGEDDVQIFSSEVIKKTPYEVTLHILRTEKTSEGKVRRQEKEKLIITTKSRLFNAVMIPYYSGIIIRIPLIIIFFFYMFIIIGVSNATNLTDGLDGLATGLGISFYVPFGVFAYLMGNAILANYLLLPYIASIGELSIFIAAAVGSFCGFLWYNVHPAEIFMGDTGSLPMGAAIATVAIMLKQELLLPIAGFVFVLETLSVIIQVFVYKRTKKRVFKMAPIHHHFELLGWKETQVVIRFWIMGGFFAVLAMSALKIR